MQEQKEIKKWKVYYGEESWKESRFYTTDIYRIFKRILQK